MNHLKDYLKQLVQFKSITPHDAGCQDFLIQFFEKLGFECFRFNNPPVSNFFARYKSESPLLVFAGHTDVVPSGDLNKWDSDPFILTEDKGMLFGRGVADMKGSLAAMMVMAEQFVEQRKNIQGSLGFLITSGEEGDLFNLGTPYVMEKLKEQGIKLNYCVVGEPSSSTLLGDVIKIGRRGSLTGKLLLQGKQGHVAYPHLAQNPIHQLSPVLTELVTTVWDEGNAYFPPTSFQATHIQAGGEANNIIPGEICLNFNVRFSTEQTAEGIKKAVHDLFERFELKPMIQWQLNGEPFLTSKGLLIEAVADSIHHHTSQRPALLTNGGTSDGRFIAPYGVEVIELGPINATIHQVNESVNLHDLELLALIYLGIAERLLLPTSS